MKKIQTNGQLRENVQFGTVVVRARRSADARNATTSATIGATAATASARRSVANRCTAAGEIRATACGKTGGNTAATCGA